MMICIQTFQTKFRMILTFNHFHTYVLIAIQVTLSFWFHPHLVFILLEMHMFVFIFCSIRFFGLVSNTVIFYWSLLFHLMYELGIFEKIDKLLFLEIYILSSVSECLLLNPFVKFMARSKDLVFFKMLRLTLPRITF